MIKINDIVGLLNNGLANHYFKDITFYKVAELVIRDEDEEPIPAIYQGSGDYNNIIDDTKSLIVYHRIIDLSNDEDLELGFGSKALTTETYQMKAVFFGNKVAIENDTCEDIDHYLAKEFKKLLPRKLNLDIYSNRVKVGYISYNKEEISSEEGFKVDPSKILFSIDYEIVLKMIEDCNELKCN